MKLRLDSSEELIRNLKMDMTYRITNMMKNLHTAETEASHAMGKKTAKKALSSSSHAPMSSERIATGAKEVVTGKREIEELQERLSADHEAIRRLRLEKKELLKTNFVRNGLMKNLSSEIMKIKAVLSTSTGYKQFMLQSKKPVPELKENFGEEIDKIINCKLLLM